MSRQTERLIVTIIVIIYAAIAVRFSLGPILEGFDEALHYTYIRYLAEKRQLPGKVWDPESGDESQQAPFYYMLGALVKTPIDDRDFSTIQHRTNPYHGYEAGTPGNDNKNVRFHPSSEDFPYGRSGTALAVHDIRLMSVALGLGTVLASYGVFQALWPARPDLRIFALTVVAFWPAFVYITSTVNNSNAAYLTSTVSLWLLLKQLRDGPSWKLSAALGIFLGLAILSKANALFLAFPVGLAVIFDRRLWRYAPLILGLTLLVGGWWYIRNFMLYGEPTGYSAYYQRRPEARIRPGTMTFANWFENMLTIPNFWAGFGIGAVVVTPEILQFFGAFGLLSVAGMAIWVARHVPRALRREYDRQSVLIAAVVVVFTAAWIAALGYAITQGAFLRQSRHLFPAIAGLSALITGGLAVFVPNPLRLRATLSGSLILLTGILVCLFGYFIPAYEPLRIVAAIPQPLNYTYEGYAQLIGTDNSTIHAQPRERVAITLYWKALRPSETELMAYVHSVDSQVVNRDSVPATGNLLSTEWRPGQTWEERYIVTIPENAMPQTSYPLIAGLFDPQSDRVLTATDAAGEQQLPVIGRIVIHGPTQSFSPVYRFGDIIGMDKPALSISADTLTVCLKWGSLKVTPVDYQVFIHVMDTSGRLLAQADFSPKQGRYPTSAWFPGEVIDDCTSFSGLKVPTGGVRVTTGLYDLASGQRLPVTDDHKARLENDEISATLPGLP